MELIVSKPITDYRIKSSNYIMEISIREYFELVKDCLKDNEYQRKRVRNSSSIYSLLKNDLKEGCIMPPIVLAVSATYDSSISFEKFMDENRGQIKILDGLQRSYTIKELYCEIEQDLIIDYNRNPLDNPIRVEVYTGINKMGILYRMLTLNTGQTQMTTRHQIEIIFSEYKDKCEVQGVRLISELEGGTPHSLGEYRFRDVVEGFTSYLQKDYLTLDRMDILDNVKNLERLSRDRVEVNPFDDFIHCYNTFVSRMKDYIKSDFDMHHIDYDFRANPYADDIVSLFNKSQSLTGFGNAIATLQDISSENTFQHVEDLISSIDQQSVNDGFIELLVDLDKVRGYAKKIGNDQRLYFYLFFKKLFDKESGVLGNVVDSARAAYKQYEHIMM